MNKLSKIIYLEKINILMFIILSMMRVQMAKIMIQMENRQRARILEMKKKKVLKAKKFLRNSELKR